MLIAGCCIDYSHSDYISKSSVRCFLSSHARFDAVASSILHRSNLDSTTLDLEHAVLLSPRSYISLQQVKRALISFWQSRSWKLAFARQVLRDEISSDLDSSDLSWERLHALYPTRCGLTRRIDFRHRMKPQSAFRTLVPPNRALSHFSPLDHRLLLTINQHSQGENTIWPSSI